jgi:Plasmid encoded RepA protein
MALTKAGKDGPKRVGDTKLLARMAAQARQRTNGSAVSERSTAQVDDAVTTDSRGTAGREGEGVTGNGADGGTVPAESKPSQELTPQQRKLIASAEVIFNSPADSADRTYLAREMVLASLPHSDPGKMPEWVRRNGNVELTIQPHYDRSKPQQSGYPYGSIPRLLMFFITAQAMKLKKQQEQSNSPNTAAGRRIWLANTFSEFVREIGLTGASGGKRGDAARVRNQMERLFRARFSLQRFDRVGDDEGFGYRDMQIAPKGYLWWNHKSPEQGTLWESWIELSEEFFNAITAAPVPVDLRALKALKRSPLALDLYAWLTYEAFRARKQGVPRFESFTQLHSHMGGDYGDVKNFAKKVKMAKKKILTVYPGLKLGKRDGGIEVLPESLTAISPREPIEGTNGKALTKSEG